MIVPDTNTLENLRQLLVLARAEDLGGGDLQDEVYGADFIVETGYVNPKRVGIIGGSYGGFMALMAIGKTPDRWAAAVSRFGVINWFLAGGVLPIPLHTRQRGAQRSSAYGQRQYRKAAVHY